MIEYIDRQAAIDALGERPMTRTDSDYELGCADQYDLDKLAIKTVPTADAGEVVRCKDCQYWTKYIDYVTLGECKLWRTARQRKAYCSEGRKRND